MNVEKMEQQHHPSALSNRVPILEELKTIVSSRPVPIKHALEVASGTGAHLEVFAPAFPDIIWQPTEYLPSLEGLEESAMFNKFGKIGNTRGNALEILDSNLHLRGNVLPALALDLTNPAAFLSISSIKYQLIHVGNTLHICPSEGIAGLFLLASQALDYQGTLTIYGPFKRHGAFTTQSNEAFDKGLRERNPAFGVRDLDSEVIQLANLSGFALESIIDMPSNNFLVVFVKPSTKM